MSAEQHTAADRRPLLVALCLLAGCTGVGTLPPAPQLSIRHQPGCRDGNCEPHCPVRPDVQGYYATRWRRWPVARAAEPTTDDGSTPVGAPRSVVPGPDEESSQSGIDDLPTVQPSLGPSPMPVRPLLPPADPGLSRPGPRPAPGQPAPGQPAPELPQPAQPPAAEPEPAIPESEENLFEARAAEARIAAIAAEASAARAAPLDEQQRFTSQLVRLLLDEHDGRVRARIVEEAATFQTAAAAAICRGGGDDPDPQVRAATCGVWERRGGSEAIVILAARGREDSDLGVRLRAIRGLGELGEQEAIDALVSLLDDPDPAVQDRVCRALGEATGQRLGNDPQTWRRWAADPEAFRRWSWLEGLRRLF
jgi:hypothetical protein